MSAVTLPRTIVEVTPSWLTAALRAGGSLTRASVAGITVQTIGQEVGFLDGLARLHLAYDEPEDGAPPSVIVKLPSGDATYRRIGDRYHAYEREIRFYAEV